MTSPRAPKFPTRPKNNTGPPPASRQPILTIGPDGTVTVDSQTLPLADILSRMNDGTLPADFLSPIQGARGKLTKVDYHPPLIKPALSLPREGTGVMNAANIPEQDKLRPTPSPYYTLHPQGKGVTQYPDSKGYVISPDHQALAFGLLPPTHQAVNQNTTFQAADTGGFIPWSSTMNVEQLLSATQRQVRNAVTQPSAKRFINSTILDLAATPNSVGPPSLRTLLTLSADEAQDKVPEIHYVITDLVNRINHEGDDQARTRLRQWSEQAHRITDGKHWQVYLSDGTATTAADYYRSLNTSADNKEHYLPSLDLKPLEVTDKGATRQTKHLQQLNPPPYKPVPPTPKLSTTAKSIQDLAATLRKWYKDNPDITPPLKMDDAIELYTKKLPDLGREKYVSSIRTPWYTIDEGTVTFRSTNSGFSEILRKAGEWWPVEIGYTVKEISLQHSQAIEDDLRRRYGIRAVEHFSSNAGVQTSLLSTPGQDRYGTSAGLPWILGYDTSNKPKTAGALNKRLKAGLPGDFTSGQYDPNGSYDGERRSWRDPEQKHKTLYGGKFMIAAAEETRNDKPKFITWLTENTSVPAIGESGEWDAGLEANAGMGRIKESALKTWLENGDLDDTASLLLEHQLPIRQFQIIHIDDEGPYKGMLEVIPDSQWKSTEADLIMSADMVKSDVKFTHGSVTRGDIKFAHNQDPYVRIGFLQQIANLTPILGQDSIDKALRHTAQRMTQDEVDAVLYDHDNPIDYNADERQVAAALINILQERGQTPSDTGLKITGSGLTNPDAARNEMSAFAKFAAALKNRDIGSAYMPGLRLYFKHWRMAGLKEEPPEEHVALQWSENPEGPNLPAIPTGFVSREDEHNSITDATDGSDLDDELVVIPGYRYRNQVRRPAVVLVRDPSSPGNNVIKYISDEDANKLDAHFGESLYWHEINGAPRTFTDASGKTRQIVDMPKAITEGPLLTDVEWQPEFTHGMPRKKSQMWSQSSAAGYVGALANAIYTLDAAGLFDPSKHKLNASDAIDAVAKGTGDPRSMLFALSDDILKAAHDHTPMPKDGIERIKTWLTPMYNARYGTDLTPAALAEQVPDTNSPTRRRTESLALHLSTKMQTQTQAIEWMANGAPSLLTGRNETSPELRTLAQSAINELTFLHQYQAPAIRASITRSHGGNLPELANEELDKRLGEFIASKERYIANQYRLLATKAMRAARLNSTADDVGGRQPGDMAVALIQARMARKTEANHEPDGYGNININGLIRALPGMEQIAFYERMEQAPSGIKPTTVLHLADSGISPDDAGTSWYVLRQPDNDNLFLVSPDGRKSHPIATFFGKNDGNAAKLVGQTVTFQGYLQTDGLTRAIKRTKPSVVTINNPDAAVTDAASLEWNRPISSMGGYFTETGPDTDSIRQQPLSPVEQANQAAENDLANLSNPTPDEKIQINITAFNRMMQELHKDGPARTAKTSGRFVEDAFTTRPDTPFGEWLDENLSTPDGYQLITSPPDTVLATVHNIELHGPQLPHVMSTLHGPTELSKLTRIGWSTRRRSRRNSAAKEKRGYPVTKG